MRFFPIRVRLFLRRCRWSILFIGAWFAFGTVAYRLQGLSLGEAVLNALYLGNFRGPFWASAGDRVVSYETAQSIQAQGDYLKAQGLGGTIVFEITQDYLSEQPTGDAQHPLMTAVRQYILH